MFLSWADDIVPYSGENYNIPLAICALYCIIKTYDSRDRNAAAAETGDLIMLIRSLRRYDGKCVRINDRYGGVYEGNCERLSPDYCLHEFGRDEEALQIVNFIFYRSYIDTIKILEDNGGPWGAFSAPYGQIELVNAADGPSFVEDVLECEDNVHIMRMLHCIESFFNTGDRPGVSFETAEKPAFTPDKEWWEGTLKAVKKLVRYTDDDAIRAEAQRIIKKGELS